MQNDAMQLQAVGKKATIGGTLGEGMILSIHEACGFRTTHLLCLVDGPNVARMIVSSEMHATRAESVTI